MLHTIGDVLWARKTGEISSKAFDHFKRNGLDSLNTELHQASFGRGSLAGETGDVFKDDPFFNPWAPGGDFNK